MTRTLFAISLAVGMVIAFAGCETTSEGHPSANTQQTNTSSIPWNRPQGWEGPGAYGSMMQGSR